MAPDSTEAKDDWDEIKADIKQLVKELRSLASQSQAQRQPDREPEPRKPKVSPILRPDFEDSRPQSKCAQIYFSDLRSRRWLAEFRPTSQNLQSLVDVLLLMFIRNKDGHAMLGNRSLDMTIVESFPSFADKLTLRLSKPPEGVKEEVTPDKMLTESAKKLREHVSSPTLWSLKLSENSPDLDPENWAWSVPRDGDFRCISVHGDNDNIMWKVAPDLVVCSSSEYEHTVSESANPPPLPILTCSFGALWYAYSMSSLS
jgi:hypothetical protein